MTASTAWLLIWPESKPTFASSPHQFSSQCLQPPVYTKVPTTITGVLSVLRSFLMTMTAATRKITLEDWALPRHFLEPFNGQRSPLLVPFLLVLSRLISLAPIVEHLCPLPCPFNLFMICLSRRYALRIQVRPGLLHERLLPPPPH